MTPTWAWVFVVTVAALILLCGVCFRVGHQVGIEDGRRLERDRQRGRRQRRTGLEVVRG
jgi:hypothetical protein